MSSSRKNKHNIWSLDDDYDINVNDIGLSTLKGAPLHVKKSFYCKDNLLTNLQYAPQYVGIDLDCSGNQITNLHNIHKQIKHIGRWLIIDDNPLQSHILGLILIDGLQGLGFDYGRLDTIMDKWLQDPRDKFDKLLLCQNELIEAGYEKYARL